MRWWVVVFGASREITQRRARVISGWGITPGTKNSASAVADMLAVHHKNVQRTHIKQLNGEGLVEGVLNLVRTIKISDGKAQKDRK